MRRALLKKWPRLTQFTHGALNPLTVEHYTLAEIGEYLTAMDKHDAAQARLYEQQTRRG